MLCVAALAAGCGDKGSNDTMAQRADRASTPPILTPGERAKEVVGDTALTAKVKTALVSEAGLKSAPIDVSTKDAVVTLSGTVESSADKARARQVAEMVQGVKGVVDNLSAKS
jgi:hyperosmotically inducible protein